MRVTYDGVQRTVEPYALTYKRPQDGVAREYFYVWDRSGGNSGKPGIRSFVNPKVLAPQILEETFEPQFEVELAKAGEESGRSYFGGQRTRSVSRARTERRRRATYTNGPVRIVECSHCGKRFKRKTASTVLKPHKDKSGYACFGRSGHFVGWE